MYYLFEEANYPAAGAYKKEGKTPNLSGPVRLKHDFKKVSGLRKLVNALIQEALAATANKTNRDKAIKNALQPLTSAKVRMGELKRFADGEQLLPRQYSALFSVIGGMIKDDTVPMVWRADVAADPQKNFYSAKPSDQAADQESGQTPAILEDDPDWLARAIRAKAGMEARV